jgi:hypothetical protein
MNMISLCPVHGTKLNLHLAAFSVFLKRAAITLPGRKSFYLVVAFPENLFRQTSIRVADALVWKPSIRLFAFL